MSSHTTSNIHLTSTAATNTTQNAVASSSSSQLPPKNLNLLAVIRKMIYMMPSLKNLAIKDFRSRIYVMEILSLVVLIR
ncbi:14281_t:CDS:2 [Entrophospora sp. SA101]|nr:14281_t:CDS:2 [Entrophospora sp. SA101]